jgi:hypothetical protein
MKSSMSFALLIVSSLPLIAEPVCAQQPEKTARSSKFCDLPKEEIDVYATYLGGDAPSRCF